MIKLIIGYVIGFIFGFFVAAAISVSADGEDEI